MAQSNAREKPKTVDGICRPYTERVCRLHTGESKAVVLITHKKQKRTCAHTHTTHTHAHALHTRKHTSTNTNTIQIQIRNLSSQSTNSGSTIKLELMFVMYSSTRRSTMFNDHNGSQYRDFRLAMTSVVTRWGKDSVPLYLTTK